MSERKREALSALVDGELDRASSARIVDDLLGDAELRRAWERYHLVGDVLRKTARPGDCDVLAARVRAALESEPIRLGRRLRPVWLRPVTGLALAASVAAVAILGVRVFGPGADSDSLAGAGAGPVVAAAAPAPATVQPASAVSPAAPAPRATLVRATSSMPRLHWVDAGPAVAARLNTYLVNHNEYLGSGTRGLLPYVRIVGYETGQ